MLFSACGLTPKQATYIYQTNDNHRLTGWTRNISNAVFDEILFQYVVLELEQAGQEPTLRGFLQWMENQVQNPFIKFLFDQSIIAFSLDEFHKAGGKYVIN
jgi:uncharacterized protein Usg